MKSIIYTLLAGSLLATSCHTIHSMPETRTASGPYVQLKSGKKFEGTSAERSTGFFGKDNVTLGDTTFKSKDIAFYSTGGATYANVGKKSFAPQVAAGKINLFRYISTYTNNYTTPAAGGYGPGTMHSSQRTTVAYYVQQKDNDPVKPLTYKNLAPLVHPRTPEYAMLEQYRHNKKISRTLGFTTLGFLVGGIAVMAASGSNITMTGAGLCMVGMTVPIGISSITVAGINRRRLLKTVLIADQPAKASHKRVK